MRLIANQAFSWAHRGIEIEQFEQGAVIDTEDADLIRVAKAEGWADEEGAAPAKPKAPKTK